MPDHCETRLLPFTAEQLFDLVLDIERYPEFVPGYGRARVVQRGESWLTVEQSLGIGPATVPFRSRAEFERPQHIVVQATDGPFRRLIVEWRFAPEPGGCRVTFRVEYLLHGLLAPLVGGWLELTAPHLLAAFARRAERIYGGVS